MKRLNILKKSIVFLLAITIIFINVPQNCYASDLPYMTYNYDYWEDIVHTPAKAPPICQVQSRRWKKMTSTTEWWKARQRRKRTTTTRECLKKNTLKGSKRLFCTFQVMH